MADAIKLSKEELEQINSFRNSINEVTFKIGDVELNKVILKNSLEEMEEEYNKLKQQFNQIKKSEKEFVSKLREKYGDGGINLESGEYIKL